MKEAGESLTFLQGSIGGRTGPVRKLELEALQTKTFLYVCTLFSLRSVLWEVLNTKQQGQYRRKKWKAALLPKVFAAQLGRWTEIRGWEALDNHRLTWKPVWVLGLLAPIMLQLLPTQPTLQGGSIEFWSKSHRRRSLEGSGILISKQLSCHT